MTDYYIDCNNQNTHTYDNMNTIFNKDNKTLQIFISNYLVLNNKFNLINNEYDLYDMINENIESFLHDKNSVISISLKDYKYFVDESFDIYVQLNKMIDFNDLYININEMSENLSFKIKNNEKIKENFYKFSFTPKNAGNLRIVGSLQFDNFKTINSDTLTIQIIDNDIENKNIYLNDKYLQSISYDNDALYSHYADSNSLLNKININNSEIIEKSEINIFSYKFIWLILIFLLSLEWYIRSRVGLL